MEEVRSLDDELDLLEARDLRFTRNEYDDLVVLRGDQRHGGVTLVRSFPRTAAHRMISLLDGDGKELGIIADLRDLDEESRKVAEDELERRYFVPRILRVVDIVEHFHTPACEAETDRGPRRFEIRSGRGGDLQVLGPRILIRDADGNHYEIPDYRLLDRASQALVDSQL